MRYYLVCDNIDTQMGMRLAGIDGVVVHTKQEVHQAVTDALADKSIGVLIITEKLANLCPDLIYDLKLNLKGVLVVVIPDRHGTGRSPDSITRSIREAIGVKL